MIIYLDNNMFKLHLGVLDSQTLSQISGAFVLWALQNASSALDIAENPQDATIRFWRGMYSNSVIKLAENEYLKLYELGQCLVISSAEDERLFSRLAFVKDKFRNRLDANLEVSLRLLISNFTSDDFPYEKAIQIWLNTCERRGALEVESNMDTGQN